MTTRKFVPVLCAALCLLALRPVLAADDPDEDEGDEAADAPWSLALATQVDQASTRGFMGELGRDLTANTAMRVTVDSTDFSSTNQAGFKSNGVELGASHEWKRFDIAGAVGRWQDVDLLTAKELKLAGDLRFDPWSVGLRGGYRRSDFDPFTSAAAVTLRSGIVVDAATRSHCKMDNTSFGADGRFQGDVWGAYATIMSYQYRDAKCSYLAGTALQQARVDRLELAALAGGVLDRLTAVATRRIGRDQTLLKSSIDAGASWKHDELVVSLDYSHQQEFLAGAASNTLSVTGTADLGDHAGVDCTIGLTRGGGVTQGGFVGFALRAKF
jgi:hypothetical protein